MTPDAATWRPPAPETPPGFDTLHAFVEAERAAQIVGCPECGQPADIDPIDLFPSTDGPVGMVRVHCVARHWFLMPLESL